MADVDGLNFVDDVEAAGYQGEFGRSDIPSLNSYFRFPAIDNFSKHG